MGWICGVVLNKAKGREMVTGYILAYFINGIYQFVVLYLMGSLIPIRSPAILLSRGYGIRNTLNLDGVRQSLDNLLMLPGSGPFSLPMATYLVIGVLCLFIIWFQQDEARAGHAGRRAQHGRGRHGRHPRRPHPHHRHHHLDRAGLLRPDHLPAEHGQRGHLQRARPDQLLRGGRHPRRAGPRSRRRPIPNVFIGVVLLHLLFVVSPLAGQNLFDSAMIGEYFRQFIGYGVIALSLVLYAWRSRKEAVRAREGLRGAAVQAAAAGTAAKAGAP